MDRLRIALTKGRLEKKSVEMFESMGFNCEELKIPSRKLLFDIVKDELTLETVLAKAPDVITYVERGVCDLGIVGKDTIMEQGRSFYEVMDLGFGKCRFALAVRKGDEFYAGTYKNRVIGTKYPEVTKNYFAKKGMDVDIVKIEGSVELAPILGLADGIVDIVETGTTLKENGLEVIETIAPISARLIVNLASMKMKKQAILSLINDCADYLEKEASK
ncbi:MAG: ATP phosphoribosyltransferase [Clostridiales bacterium]|nr:ATP phosphoribosyltransferase [Clostridiales bacterium]